MKKAITLAAIAALAPVLAFADNTNGGFYVGGTPFYMHGKATAQLGFGENLSDNSDVGSANGMGLNAFAGYQFGKYFAIEAGPSYIYSTSTHKGLFGGYAALKGIVPFAQKYDVYAKLGASMQTGPAIMYSIGGDIKLDEHWSVGPQFTYLDDIDQPLPFIDISSTFMLFGVQTSYTF